MADYNRNDRGSNRNSNQDWNDYRNRSGRSENDNDRNFGYGNDMGFDEDDSSWQNRYERQDSNRGSGRYGRNSESDMNSSSWGSDRGYGSSNYGSSNFGSSSSNYGSGMSGGMSGRRNLYDRDYEGMGRSSYSNSGSRLGAGNYGSYGDRGRFNEGRSGGSYGYGNSGSNYGGNFGRQDFNRSNEDRGWWDRASDEVSSWFGDEEAERRRDRDKQHEGAHKGRGPKNYTRSDERIKEDINDRLSDDPFIDASEIDVTVSSGEVTLTGSVDHRSTKRRAEDLAESVSGVKNVENRIRVGQTSSLGTTGSGSMGSTTSGSMGSTASGSTSGSTQSSSASGESQSTSAVPGSDRSRSKGHYVTG
jgi:osmotically-inducible protein OsmY